MEKAIQIAIESGYEGLTFKDVETKNYQWQFPADVFLDSLFWQALQKTQPSWRRRKAANGKEIGQIVLSSPFGYALNKDVEWWEYTMHRFIDHLAEGRDANDFFTTLLETK